LLVVGVVLHVLSFLLALCLSPMSRIHACHLDSRKAPEEQPARFVILLDMRYACGGAQLRRACMKTGLAVWGWHLGRSFLLLSVLLSCSHGTVPRTFPIRTASEQRGIASWYGEPFHGRRTANGEVYDMYRLTAAHKTAPLGIRAIVTNLANGRSVRVRINDRGPFVGNRILDLSYAAAQKLDMVEDGVAPVRIRFLDDTIPEPVFVVQAGAFSNPTNATRVRQKLVEHYHRVWIGQIHDGSHTFYRVWIGRFTSRRQAEQIAAQVEDMGFAARVLPLPPSAEPPTQSASRM
jgi:rare lipoprotein A